MPLTKMDTYLYMNNIHNAVRFTKRFIKALLFRQRFQDGLIIIQCGRFERFSHTALASEDILLHISLIKQHFDTIYQVLATVLHRSREERCLFWNNRDIEANWMMLKESIWNLKVRRARSRAHD